MDHAVVSHRQLSTRNHRNSDKAMGHDVDLAANRYSRQYNLLQLHSELGKNMKKLVLAGMIAAIATTAAAVNFEDSPTINPHPDDVKHHHYDGMDMANASVYKLAGESRYFNEGTRKECLYLMVIMGDAYSGDQYVWKKTDKHGATPNCLPIMGLNVRNDYVEKSNRSNQAIYDWEHSTSYGEWDKRARLLKHIEKELKQDGYIFTDPTSPTGKSVIAREYLIKAGQSAKIKNFAGVEANMAKAVPMFALPEENTLPDTNSILIDGAVNLFRTAW